MIRPQLLLHCVRAVGGETEPLVAAALSVEYLHVGTLVHDDIIDGDDLRRGRPSVHARYGLPNAIVTGDHLMFEAVASLVRNAAPHSPPAAVAEAAGLLAEAGGDLCRGQTMEARLCGGDPGDPRAYRAMIELKTASLFRAACEIGAVLGGGTGTATRALRQFGRHLGLAFQMWDDLLPYVSSEAVAGKPALSDVTNHRVTLPVLAGYEVAGEEDRLLFTQALNGTLSEVESHRLLVEALDNTGAVQLARRAAELEVDAAKSHLAHLPGRQGAAALAALADAAVNRWK